MLSRDDLAGIANRNINPLRQHNPALPMGMGFNIPNRRGQVRDVNKYMLIARSASEIAEKQWDKRLVKF